MPGSESMAVCANVDHVTEPEGDLRPTLAPEVELAGDAAGALAPSDAWDLAGRDTVPDLTATGGPRDVGSALLFALLSSDGAAWQPPYDRVREALGVRKKIVLPELE